MATVDPVVNFGKATVSIGYDNVATSIALVAGQGAKLPAAQNYNAVWWDATTYPDPADDPNREIVRVTAGQGTDTLTVTRAQEGTSASTKNTLGSTYKMQRTLTAADYNNFVDPGICEGRLTLTTLTPVTTGDVTAATTIYFTPYKGSRISLYNGTIWRTYQAANGADFCSLALGTLADGTKPYDVFCYDNGGTLTLEFLVWTSTTARATALVLQDGVLCKSGALTRRYLGTFMPTATTTTEDSAANRYLWNYYNRIPRKLKAVDATASWSQTTSTWRQARTGTTTASNSFNFVIGVAETLVEAEVSVNVQANQTGQIGNVGIALDWVSGAGNEDINIGAYTMTVSTGGSPARAIYKSYVAVGKHTLNWIEQNQGNVNTISYYGTGAVGWQAGMLGTLDA